MPRRKQSLSVQSRYSETRNVLNSIVSQLLLEVQNGAKPLTVFNLKYVKRLLSQFGLKGKFRTRKAGRKPSEQLNFSYFLKQFFKPYHNFKGRQKIFSKVDADINEKVIGRTNTILNLLGAKLKIPDTDSLRNNPLLDEFDIKILEKLSLQSDSAESMEPLPSTSTSRSEENINLVPNSIIMSIPPDPITLRGFRGLMLHADLLKNNAGGYYQAIDRFLPEIAKYRSDVYGMKHSRELIEAQLNELTTNKEQVLAQRDLFEKRFKALFKWPAIMSSPINLPPDNVFTASKPADVKHVRKVGRPPKITNKLQKMHEARKRKKNITSESTEKRIKTEIHN